MPRKQRLLSLLWAPKLSSLCFSSFEQSRLNNSICYHHQLIEYEHQIYEPALHGLISRNSTILQLHTGNQTALNLSPNLRKPGSIWFVHNTNTYSLSKLVLSIRRFQHQQIACSEAVEKRGWVEVDWLFSPREHSECCSLLGKKRHFFLSEARHGVRVFPEAEFLKLDSLSCLFNCCSNLSIDS